jgi:hypothetical protein
MTHFGRGEQRAMPMCLRFAVGNLEPKRLTLVEPAPQLARFDHD